MGSGDFENYRLRVRVICAQVKVSVPHFMVLIRFVVGLPPVARINRAKGGRGTEI